jgi:hypothetical protein
MEAIRVMAEVNRDGKIEVSDPSLVPGSKVELIILHDRGTKRIPIAELWGTGQGAYSSPAEADRFLRELRDEWD